MALVIIGKDKSEYEYHIPFSKGFLARLHVMASSNDIELIQADGDELGYILRRFNHLPYAYRITIWRGEMARFIGENL